MKRTLFGLVALASLIGLLGGACALSGPPVGTIAFTIPEKYLTPIEGETMGSRAITVTVPYVVRVWLGSQGALRPLGTDGKLYFEQTVTSTNNTVVISEVAKATGCTLYLALGTGSGSSFVTINHARTTSLFDIVAGAVAEIALKVELSPFKQLAALDDAKGVEVEYLPSVTGAGTYYFLANGFLYSAGTGATAAVTSASSAIAVTGANGLSIGKKITATSSTLGETQLWVDTTAGIIPLENRSLGTAIGGSEGKNVLESGTVHTLYDGSVFDAVFFQRAGSAGFGYFKSGSWNWTDLLDTLKNQAGFSALYDILIKNSSTKLIADYHLEYDADGYLSYGYGVIPAINTARGGMDMVSTLKTVFSSSTVDFNAVKNAVLTNENIITVPKAGTVQPLINSLSKAGNYLYVGTDKGVFIFVVNPSTGKITVPPTTAARTMLVCALEAKEYSGHAYAAALDKQGNLFLFKDGVYTTTSYYFHTGLPAAADKADENCGLLWSDEGLVVTGTNGAVLLPYGKLP
jgi:hypothetical protein